MQPTARRLSIGQVARVGALLVATLGVPPAPSAAPRLSATLPDQLEKAEDALKAALAALTEAPSQGALKRAEAAMERIERALDAFFHAPNLLVARTEARALRPLVQRLRAEGGLVVQVNDVMHFSPAVHARLAAARAALGDARGALRHHLALVAADPSPAHLEAAAHAADAAQDAAAAAALRARIP